MKNSLQFDTTCCIICFASYGSLVKRSRRRPLTAKTAVRFRYELLILRMTEFNRLWLVGQAVKTSPSHGENSGSIPLRAALYLRYSPTPKKHSEMSAFLRAGKVSITGVVASLLAKDAGYANAPTTERPGVVKCVGKRESACQHAKVSCSVMRTRPRLSDQG